MRIAYLYHRSDTMGGAPIHLRDLSRRLIDSGHEARIFLGGDGPFLGNLEAHDVPFETLKIGYFRQSMRSCLTLENPAGARSNAIRFTTV